MQFYVTRKTVNRTGIAKLGWHVGHGYVSEKFTVATDVWCVMKVAHQSRLHNVQMSMMQNTLQRYLTALMWLFEI